MYFLTNFSKNPSLSSIMVVRLISMLEFFLLNVMALSQRDYIDAGVLCSKNPNIPLFQLGSRALISMA